MTNSSSYPVHSRSGWSELVIATTAEWTWGRTFAVGFAAMLLIRIGAAHVAPSLSGPAEFFACCVLGGMLAMRYCGVFASGAFFRPLCGIKPEPGTEYYS